jgi:dolichol-phosphate mannosyltransferase
MLSIIVPTYREAENIHPLVQRIRAALDTQGDYEIVFVDDNSADGTEARVEAERQAGAPVRLIVRTTERGLSSAILRGFREARGDLLLCLDADMSHPPESIPALLQALADQQADLVVGSRYVQGGGIEKGWGLYRWLNSQVALWLARPLSRVRDSGAGFFLLPRQIFEQGKNLNPIGYKALLEVSVKCPCRKVVEVPIQFADRKFGQSKLNLREQLLYLLHLKRLYDYCFPRATLAGQFCVIGLTGVAVNWMILALLLALGLPLGLAYALAVGAAITWNYWPNRWLTFDLMGRHPVGPQFRRFVTVCLLGGVTNWGVTMELARHLDGSGRPLFIATLAGIATGGLVNFMFWARNVVRVGLAPIK